jgi:hypothetical protein
MTWKVGGRKWTWPDRGTASNDKTYRSGQPLSCDSKRHLTDTSLQLPLANLLSDKQAQYSENTYSMYSFNYALKILALKRKGANGLYKMYKSAVYEVLLSCVKIREVGK